jgi:hypothetical protein
VERFDRASLVVDEPVETFHPLTERGHIPVLALAWHQAGSPRRSTVRRGEPTLSREAEPIADLASNPSFITGRVRALSSRL